MNAAGPKYTTQIAIVALFAALGGASLWFWGGPSRERAMRVAEAKKATEFQSTIKPILADTAAAADGYIEAVIAGDCNGVVERTEWLQARKRSIGETGLDWTSEQGNFCEHFFSREENGYWIAPEGVDDPYLFFEGVEYELVGQDEGRQDLNVPVSDRVWVELRYPSPERCLRDLDGRAISGLTVGMNLTPEGLIAKANVLGNAEIQWESLRYSW